MSEQNDNRFSVGSRTFEEVMGVPPDGFINSLEHVAPGFARLIVETEFGAAYNRPGLDLKTRELVIIASCGALGATGLGAVRMHVPAALRAGATRAEITETLVQIAFAAGLPASIAAVQAAAEVFAQIDARGEA